jgi:hypothetical protein
MRRGAPGKTRHVSFVLSQTVDDVVEALVQELVERLRPVARDVDRACGRHGNGFRAHADDAPSRLVGTGDGTSPYLFTERRVGRRARVTSTERRPTLSACDWTQSRPSGRRCWTSPQTEPSSATPASWRANRSGSSTGRAPSRIFLRKSSPWHQRDRRRRRLLVRRRPGLAGCAPTERDDLSGRPSSSDGRRERLERGARTRCGRRRGGPGRARMRPGSAGPGSQATAVCLPSSTPSWAWPYRTPDGKRRGCSSVTPGAMTHVAV